MTSNATTQAAPVVLDARVVTGSGGGPDKTILNSPRFLELAGYRMLCAYLRPPNDPGFDVLRQRAKQLAAPLVEIDDSGPLDFGVPWKLLRLCRREGVQIYHGHDYKSNALGLLLRRFWPMRLVTTAHGWVKHTARTPYYYRVDRFCIRRYESVLCVSEDIVHECQAFGVPAERCLLLENGIDTQQFARTLPTRAAKEQCGFSPRRLLLGAVGRLSEEKGFTHLILAADRLLTEGLDLHLVIVGEGDQLPELQQLIDSLGRGERIHLLGYRAELLDLYQAMDVFVLSSDREGLPNVLLEAMAVATPVVATRIAGVPRLIQHEENGLLVEPGNVAELSTALGRLLGDAALRRRLGTAGRRTIETRYSFATRMDHLRQHYDQLLGRQL